MLERTRIGALMRATVDDPEMARGVGINVHGISMGVVAVGAMLAAVAGVVAGGFVGGYPGPDFEILALRVRRSSSSAAWAASRGP